MPDSARDVSDAPAQRELLAVREIAHALLVADRPEAVYQFALDRLTPLLGAAFSLVMRLGDDGETLRPVAQHDWPARHRAWIGALRVRRGTGPSGVAVAERRLVEVRDLFADDSATDWHDVARELDFRSILAAPLVGGRGVLGAIAFYFADETEVTDEQRALVQLVADQLAASAEKAQLIDDLRRANAALAEANAQLEELASSAEASRVARDRQVERVASDIESLLSADARASADVKRAAELARVMRELVDAERGARGVEPVDCDPRTPLLAAVAAWRARSRTTPIVVDEPTVMLPTVRTDAVQLERLLDLMLGVAMRTVHGSQGTVHAAIELARGFLAERISWTTADGPLDVEMPELLLARVAARRLGGELRIELSADDAQHGVDMTLVFPVEVDR